MDVHKLTLDALLRVGRMIVANLQADPTLLALMQKVGFGEARVLEGKALVEALDDTYSRQQASFGDVTEAVSAAQVARALAEDTYGQHAWVAKLTFEDETHIIKRLALKGDRENALAKWVVQCRTFYVNLLNDNTLLARMADEEQSDDDLKAGLAQVNEAEQLNQAQQRVETESQRLTDLRKVQKKALAKWIVRCHRRARVACRKDKQQLEKLGLKVR